MRQHTIRVAGAEFYHPGDMEEAVKVGQEIGHHLERGDPDDITLYPCGCVVWYWPWPDICFSNSVRFAYLDDLIRPTFRAECAKCKQRKSHVAGRGAR